MSRIGILGLGNFGTALARVWLEDGHTITGWTVEQEVYDSLVKTTVNEKYLPDVPLKGLTPTMDLAEGMRDAEIVVLALPSGVVLKVAEDVIPLLQPGQVVIDIAKGLAPGDRLISEALQEQFDAAGKTNPLAVIMGPTIAPELARGVTTIAMVACEDSDQANELAATLSTRTFHLEAAQDTRGAEYWGAFKNVIALACGIVDGLRASGRGGDNMKAAIFMTGYREGSALLPLLGARPETALGPAGIGDLFVTATSPHGRNREMGQRLGEGQTLEQAEREMVMVAEGVRATRMFHATVKTMDAETPLLNALAALLDGDIDVDAFVQRVLGV